MNTCLGAGWGNFHQIQLRPILLRRFNSAQAMGARSSGQMLKMDNFSTLIIPDGSEVSIIVRAHEIAEQLIYNSFPGSILLWFCLAKLLDGALL